MQNNQQVTSKLQDLKHLGEAAWAETHAIATGLGTALKSGVVVRGGGVKGKAKLVESIARYGFTAGRQAWYAAEVAPNRTAIIDDIGERTYAEVRSDSLAFARALQRRGLGPGKNIAVMARNSRVVVYALVAKGFIGADISLLNPASSPVQLQKSMDELDVHTIIIDEEFADRLPADYSRAKVIIGYAEDLENPQAPNPEWKTFQQVIDRAPPRRRRNCPRSRSVASSPS